MTAVLGSGEHRYRVVENWAKLPEGWEFKDVAAVAVDSKDRVYAFNRGEHPIIVFDRAGNFLRSWGEGAFPRAHGIHIDADDTLYLTDDGGHFVRKCTTEGKVLMEIGVPGTPTPYMSGKPFHRCTHTALSPKGEIYVSDGYGNAKIHKYSPTESCSSRGASPGPIPGSSTSAQHRDRRGRLGLRRRPRESSRAGLRRQRQVRNAMGQHAPAVRAVLLPRQVAALPDRRARPGHDGEPQPSEHRAAPLDRGRDRKDDRALGGEAGPGLESGKFVAPPRSRSRFARRHLRRRSQLHRVPAAIPDQGAIPFRMRSLQKLEKIGS
jgi:hypothetical protein